MGKKKEPWTRSEIIALLSLLISLISLLVQIL